MNNLRYKFMAFMQGRHGNDKLNTGILILYCIIAFIRIFIRGTVGRIALSATMAVLLLVWIFRVLSKNIYARERENAVFSNFIYKIKPKITLLKNRLRDIKTKRYRTCPHCKEVLRLPNKRGKHGVKCPKCGGVFEVRII